MCSARSSTAASPTAPGTEHTARSAAVGLDVRYALTPQTSAYVTLNPDFATIEADQEEINLTRFELAVTEKRQFFLEGQERFGQRIQTFYSRRIAAELRRGFPALERGRQLQADRGALG